MEASNDLFGRILRRGPSQGTLFLILTKMKEEGRSSEVIQECLRALSIYPDDIRLRSLLAESYLEEGYIEQAEAELGKVTSMIDDLTSAYKLQAEIYNQQQRPVEASDTLKRYLAHNPDDREAQELLAVVSLTEEEPAIEPLAEELEAVPVEREPDVKPVEVTPEVEPVEDELEVEPVEEGPELESIGEDVAEITEGEPAIEVPGEIEDVTPAPEDEKDVFTGLATPTLAEIYYDQGLIQEAIITYEEVLSNNPNDKASAQRLAELKAMISVEEVAQVGDVDDLRAGKEKMIGILEAWRARILETRHA